MWHVVSRFKWVVLQVLASIISYIYIEEAYGTWQNSPVVISVNNNQTLVWDIPFPAVTICSLPSINTEYSLKDHISRCFDCDAVNDPLSCSKTDNCNFTELAEISLAYTMCIEYIWYHLNSSEVPFGTAWKTFFDPLFGNTKLQGDISLYMREILPKCKRIFLPQEKYEHLNFFYNGCSFSWQTLLIGINSAFTDPPVCYTFNSLRTEDLFEDNVLPPIIDDRIKDYKSKVSLKKKLWTTDNMMDFAEKGDSLPIYGLDHLYIQFDRVRSQNFFLCHGNIEINSRIGFHHPGEVPMFDNTNFYSFELNKSISIYITPKMMSAHINLVDYEPAKRLCYFSHEKKLSLFKFYTQKNCQLECKTNCTLEKCGCIPYSLPRHNDSVKLCDAMGWRCSQEVKAEQTLFYRAVTKWVEKDTPPACVCRCLPDCNSLSYDFEVGEITEPKFVNFSNIKIMYKVLEFSSMVRYSVTSWGEFVAYSLGILGVFNGLCGVGMFDTVLTWSARTLRHCRELWPVRLTKNTVRMTKPDNK